MVNSQLFSKISRNYDNIVNIGLYYEEVNAITSRQCDCILL